MIDENERTVEFVAHI